MDGLIEPQMAPCLGKQLRAQRIRAGLALPELAFTLNIRQRQLEAIEAGAYHKLPAGVYAEGFVRAYAREVGLDPTVAVERFRLEMGGMALPVPALKFPDPQPETGIPNGAVLFVGAVIAIVAYGSWYLSSGKPVQMAEGVAPVPAHLEQRLLAADPAAAVSSVPREAPFVPGIVSAPIGSNGNALIHDRPADLPSFAPAAGTPGLKHPARPANPGTPTPALAPSFAGSAGVPLAATGTVVTAASARASALPEVAADAPKPIATARSASLTDDLPTVAVTSQANVALAAEPPPQDAGASAGGDGRVVLRARSDTWVEIRDPASNTLITARLLHPGESYRPPDRPGLRLLTGNAGGLQVFVDGRATPPLGRDGTVRRNIPLDVGPLTAALDRAN